MINLIDMISGKEIEWKQWFFPGGEVGVQITKPLGTITNVLIKWTGLIGLHEPMVIRQLVDALKHEKQVYVSLFVPYFPYARQDRYCSNGESYALSQFVQSTFIGLDINGLIVWDLHSSKSRELIKDYVRCDVVEIQQYELTRDIVSNYDCLIFPDEGAAKKAQQYQNAGYNGDFITMKKFRSGGMVVYGEFTRNIAGKKCLVVDDICDGGATFVSMAHKIYETHKYPDLPHTLDLYVTHGIFSRGIDNLLGSYNNVFTANLMSPDPSVADKIEIIS
jgi:ribose-phosphate pyrophosphokinase